MIVVKETSSVMDLANGRLGFVKNESELCYTNLDDRASQAMRLFLSQ